MKLFVDGKIVESKDQPLVVIFTAQDRINISNMASDATIYCVYETDNHTVGEIETLLDNVKSLAEQNS